MEALVRWGWDTTRAERFAGHAPEGCVPGRVSAEHRGLYYSHGPGGERTARVSGRLRHRASGRADYPAVGDWVALRESSGAGPAVIEAVLPRTNRLSRQAPGDAVGEQVLAANLDVLFLVTSLNLDLSPPAHRAVHLRGRPARLPTCRAAHQERSVRLAGRGRGKPMGTAERRAGPRS